MRASMIVFVSFAALLVSISTAQSAGVPNLVWINQFGTSASDWGSDASANSLGDVYIGGYTNGSLAATNAGSYDVTLSRYSESGSLMWARQFGTADYDAGYGVATDKVGYAYITGTTRSDAFVAKYNAGGDAVWTRNIGTTDSDYLSGVSADGFGNVYVGGYTSGSFIGANAGHTDAYLAKFDAGGNQQWVRQLGSTEYEYAGHVATDSLGNVYLGGRTGGDLFGLNAGASDSFVAKFDADGNLLWGRQLGTTAEEQGLQVATDREGNVFFSGITWGDLGGPLAGSYDSFVGKYSANGDLLWLNQFGSINADECHGVTVDGAGSVYVGGATWGNLGGPNAGLSDAFVTKYDQDGNFMWTFQFGTTETDWGNGLSADESGNVYLSGLTSGSLGGLNAGSYDAFIAKINEIPEPSTLVLLGIGAISLLGCAWRTRRRTA
jgi:hypothetical protein